MHPVCLISRQHLKQFLQKATKRLMPEYFVLKYSIIEQRNWSNLVFYPLCSIYSNSSHVVWCMAIIDIILKVDILVVIQAKFKLAQWFQRSRFLSVNSMYSYVNLWSTLVAILDARQGTSDISFENLSSKEHFYQN